MDDARPGVVILGAALLGVITLAALRPADTGRRSGMAAVVSSRALWPYWYRSTSSPTPPGWAEVITAALTAVALGLLYAPRREQAYAPAAT